MQYNIEKVYGNPISRTGHFGVKYRDINMVKCPFDYVLLQMVLSHVKPDLVIEIGTHEGGTNLLTI